MAQKPEEIKYGITKLKEISIPSTSLVENYVVYHIKVSLEEYSWIVRKRYREFCELHEKLTSKYAIINRNLFPPKRYVGNLNPHNVEKRRESLELYLQDVSSKLEKIPRVLQIFLEFHFYDIFAVTQTLAEKLFKVGDSLLLNEEPFVLTPLQLYCISQRLKLPIPTCDSEGYYHDVGNLYDIIYCVKYLKIIGDENHDLIGLSNEEISYNLSLFKSLKSLEVLNCNIESLQGTYHLQNNARSLKVVSSIHLLKDILIDQDVWTPGVDVGTFTHSNRSQTSLYPTCTDMVWKCLTEAVFSYNSIPYIDESVTLLHKLEKLDLSHNKIKDIEHLLDLPHLTELNLSHNQIEIVANLATKLGNIQVLNLSSNKLQSVGGLPKVYSLVDLDLSSNNIDDVSNISALADLPCLEVLNLIDNPVRTREMYRPRLLTAFEDRVSQICLDNTKPTRTEIGDVMQFLSRVNSYEIVNSPNREQSCTTTKHRTAYKKGNRRIRIKNQDVFESSVEVSVSPLPNRERKFTDGELQFKTKVEQIRKLGGDEWLGILNELQNEYKQPVHAVSSSSANTTKPNEVRATAVEGSTASHVKNKHIRNQVHSSDFVHREADFGFSNELEALVAQKMKQKEKLVAGTYFTNVEFNQHKEGEEHPVKTEEERMIGIDLGKGVLMEIEIDSGRTCAKHKLCDVSSADILETAHSVYLELRHKQGRCDVSSDTTPIQGNVTGITKYKMRSLADAAELFVLLFKVVNDSAKSRPRIRTDSSDEMLVSSLSTQPQTASGEAACVILNPAGISAEFLDRWLCSKFLCERSSENELTESERDAVQTNQEIVHLTLWTTCLPYALPEHELPVCLVLTNRTIYLFQVKTGGKSNPLSSYDDVEARLPLLCCLPLAQLHVVICGLFDLGFRVEFSKRGSRGTFTFLTRDPHATETFIRTLSEVAKSSGERHFEIIYPSEEKLDRMKGELATSCGKAFNEDERLLMYALVREFPDMTSLRDSHVISYTRTLVVTNCRLFLCEEDHVHWPLPSYVKDAPSTPQWVVTKHDDVRRIVGIELFDVVGENTFTGNSGLSIILENHAHSSRNETKMWNLVFKCAEEREQLQRSLSQIWSFNFHGSLQITAVTSVHAKRLRRAARTDVPSGFFHQVITPALSPPGSPSKPRAGKGHRRNASGQYISKQHGDVVGKSLQFVQKSDAESLEEFFTSKLRPAAAGPNDETIVCHTWTGCVAYTHPSREIFVWLILSNLKVYIVADVSDRATVDAAQNVTFCPGTELCFNWFPMTSLRQVCVGFFDQTFRLETDDPESTFTFITRDYQATGNILDNLKLILQDLEPEMLPSRPNSSPEAEYPSIYDGDTTVPGSEVSELYSQHGLVKFVYPNDDSLDLLRHTIVEFSKNSDSCPEISDATILLYLLVFQIMDGKKFSRTFMILDEAVCLSVENHVNFPLPLFVKGLPMGSRYEIQNMCPLTRIKRIEFSGFNTQDFTIVFGDITHGILDSGKEGVDNASPSQDVRWTLIAQTYEEKEKALAMILKFCKDKYDTELPVLKI